MKTWVRLFLGVFVLVLSARTAHAQVELRNDTFMDGGNAGFQQGFVATEIGASRFDAPADTQKLLKVTILFGGLEGVTRSVILHVFDDSAATVAPGLELFVGEFQLTSSNTMLQELDLSTENVIVPQTFRVGIEMVAADVPSIARDDGPVVAGHNFIRVEGGQWVDANQAFGLQGNWIVRATVEGQGGTGATTSAATTSAGSTNAATASTGASSGTGPSGSGASSGSGTGGGSGEACAGNGDCPPYQYCSDRNVCTFDCRADDDCTDGQTCNSLGQCVGGESSGCNCRTGSGNESPLTTFFGVLGVVLAAAGLRARRKVR